MAQIDAAALFEQHHLVGVPGKAHRLLDGHIGPGRHRGAHHRVADAQRQDLFDAMVLDVVDVRLDRRAALEVDILGPNAEDERAAIGRRIRLGSP